jgi:hypothetical protein
MCAMSVIRPTCWKVFQVQLFQKLPLINLAGRSLRFWIPSSSPYLGLHPVPKTPS